MSKKISILAIDDEQDILYTLSAIGTAVGWKVYTESNSLEAMAKVASLKPDIILLDYHMPQQNGVLAVKKIRELDGTVPIIVLTIDGRQELADEFLAAGASDFATKPIKVPDLVARINVHLKLLAKQREAEGRSIVTLARQDGTALEPAADPAASFVAFSAQTRMSGVDTDNSRIRKGASDAVRAFVEQQGGSLSQQCDEVVQGIARQGGTPPSATAYAPMWALATA